MQKGILGNDYFFNSLRYKFQVRTFFFVWGLGKINKRMLMDNRKVFVVSIIDWWEWVLSNVNQSVRSSTTFVEIKENFVLFDLFGINIEFIPRLRISSVPPIMPTDCISTMNENVHQTKFLLSAFYFLQLFFNLFQLLLYFTFLAFNFKLIRKFLLPAIN